MKKVGLITYHATHNYGAVLQAFATQYAVEKAGASCEIINFRPLSMKYFNSLYYAYPRGAPFKKDIKLVLGPLYRFMRNGHRHIQRVRWAKKLDCFVRGMLKTTKEYTTCGELDDAHFDYDIFITGSDQTWNIRCPLWALNRKRKHILDYSAAYFLGFVKSGKKASFAASTANSTTEDLMPLKDLLEQYDYITVRESLSKERVEAVVHKPVHAVVDPTFLLTKQEWLAALGVAPAPVINEPYVLLYSLHWNKIIDTWVAAVKKFAQKRGLKVVCITPLAFKKFKEVIQIYDAGPLDFLNIYNNASYVFADSFHGVCFSIIFRKSFLALGNKYNPGDTRKESLLQVFNLESRIVENEDEINTYPAVDMNYQNSESTITETIEDSRTHLKRILSL
ncbi:hypothetical protein FACS189442_2410 [Spirochaetia bacterium]|nr:hypothetical protein FACS189442_2410 [Spirochaetia bacterium]